MNHREHGSVSIVMLGVLVMSLVVSMGAARLGGALVGRARADTAADAAALAAADALASGDGADAALAAAHGTAVSNGARLVSCSCSETTADVVVEVDLPALGALVGPARGHAKAEVRPECIVDLPGC
ncbi:MAG: Rv3654c family TadE-like protein [Acidimicrobiia bacterium]